MLWPRYDVFLSYSRLDSAKTDLFVDALGKGGYCVFYDKQSLSVGERWKESLNRGIKSSRVCILCWSEHTKSSEIVAYEYSRPEGLRKPVLPWLLDSTPLPRMIEIQGVTERDPLIPSRAFVLRLGWNMTFRRRTKTG